VSGRAAAEHRYSWDEIADVRSGVIEDEGGTVPVLSLRLVDDALLPRSPWGAVVAPPWLHLYAAEWDLQAHDLVPMIETHLNRARQSVAEE
jgi:hypothetical protein